MSERTQWLIIAAVCVFVLGAFVWELTRGLIYRHEQRKAEERLDVWERMRR